MAAPTDITLRAHGVVLQPFIPRDEDELLAAVRESITEISPYETWCTDRFGSRDAEHYIQGWRDGWREGSAHYFAIRDVATRRFLGSAGLAGIDRTHRVAGLGYWVRTLDTGRGVATAATGAVARWGMTARRLNRIEVMCAVDNPASRRVAEKIGAQLEGVLRRRLILPSGPTDMAVYSLVS